MTTVTELPSRLQSEKNKLKDDITIKINSYSKGQEQRYRAIPTAEALTLIQSSEIVNSVPFLKAYHQVDGTIKLYLYIAILGGLLGFVFAVFELLRNPSETKHLGLFIVSFFSFVSPCINLFVEVLKKQREFSLSDAIDYGLNSPTGIKAMKHSLV